MSRQINLFFNEVHRTVKQKMFCIYYENINTNTKFIWNEINVTQLNWTRIVKTSKYFSLDCPSG